VGGRDDGEIEGSDIEGDDVGALEGEDVGDDIEGDDVGVEIV